jgi:dTDP-4-dehydrorhamnose reductase
MMPAPLIIGASGQLGWELVGRVSKTGLPYQALERAELDITNRDSVLCKVQRLSPSVVVNAAAYTNVDKAESESQAAFSVNRDGAAHLAEACAAIDIPIIHISTDYVFDGSKRQPYVEDDPVAPLGVYGSSKLAGEEAIRQSSAKHIILRTAWLYGIHGHNFAKTMLRLGRERDELRVVDDQLGTPTFVGDLAESIVALLGRLQSGVWPDRGFGTFHCTAQGATTWCGFARKIFELVSVDFGKRPKIEAIKTSEYKTPAERPLYSVLDCSRLARVHGIVMRPWTAGLADMLDVGAELWATKK